jgi:hypothetical protein
MSDISNQLIKDSYDYVLQSDLSTGIVYRIGGGIPVNPTFLSGITVNSTFTFADGSEANGYVLTSDASGNATWQPISAATPSSGVTSITVGNGLSANSSTGAVTIVFTGSTGISGEYLPLSGGTVTGDTIFQSGLTATTISATTYQNLPLSLTSTTQSGNTLSIVNSTGGTSTYTLNAVTGGSYSNGTITLSGTGNVNGNTITGFPTSLTGDYLPLSGGTLTGGLVANSGVTANTISQVSYVDFTTGTTNPSINGGRVFFDKEEQSLSYYSYLNNPVVVNTGQQLYLRVFNYTLSAITKGSVVTILSQSNGLPAITLAINSTTGTTGLVAGLAAETIQPGSSGLTITNGIISGLNIPSTYTPGDVIYLDYDDPGMFSNSVPSFPLSARTNEVGYIIQTGTTTGKVYVNVNNENIQLSLTDLQRNVLEGNVLSTGVFAFSGLSLVSVSGTTFNIAPVQAWIVENTSNYLKPTVQYITYSGQSNVPATFVNTATQTYVLLTSGGTILQQTSFPTPQQRRENIYLGKLGHANRTFLINAFNEPDFDVSPLAQLRDMFTPIKLINGGIYPSPNGANLSFNTSSGVLYGLGIGWVTNTLNPDSLSVSGTNPCTFQYRTQTGGTTSNTTLIIPGVYDNNGVITAVGGGSNSSTNQRIYLVQNGSFRMQYGQQVYSTLADAISNAQSESFTTFSNFRDNAILIAILSVNKNATNLSDTTQARFLFTSKFGETVGASGGISTTNLQQAYNNSVEPEILINSTLDGVSIQNGTGNADNVSQLLQGKDAAGTVTSFIRADGAISGSTIYGNGSGLTHVFNSVHINGITQFSANTNTFINFSGINVNITSGANNTLIFSAGTGGSSGTSGFDVYVTGGSYNGSQILFTNNSGGTFTVTGLTATGFSANYYASFSDSTNQPVSGANIGTVWKYNTTELSNGISVVDNTKITVQNTGVYEIGYSPQIEKTQGTNANVTIWAAINGNPVARSSSTFGLVSNSVLQLPFVSFIFELNANDYVEFYFSSDNQYVQLTALSGLTTPTRPDSPSVIIVAKQVGLSTTAGATGDTFVTGFSLSNDVITLRQNRVDQYSAFTVSLSAYTAFTGGTVSGATNFTGGLSANTISATTYQNVNAVTGGSYSDGTITLSGTGNVNGAQITGLTKYFVSATTPTSTFLNGDRWFDTTNGIEFVYLNDGDSQQWVQPNAFINSTINGTLSATTINTTTISATTYQNLPGSSSSNCLPTLYVSSISGCSPVTILTPLNVTDGANITGVTNFYNNVVFSSGVTISSSTNSTFGSLTATSISVNGNLTVTGDTSLQALTSTTISATTYQNLPTDIRVTGATYSNNNFTFTNNTGGTFSVLFNTVTGLTVNGGLSVTGTTSSTSFSGNSNTISGAKGGVISNGSTTTAFITVSGSNTVGGTEYTDFIRVTNTAAGATNPNKTIRVNNTGGIEFLNSAYSAVTLNLGDNGILYVGGGNSATVSNNDATTNYLSFNLNNSQIYDDGNTHIHARGNGNSMWINTNNAVIFLGNQSPVAAGGAASAIIMGSGSTTTRAFANIYGGKTYTIGGYGYLATIGAGTGAGTTATYGLYVQQRVEATEFDATSDERLKNIQGEIELNDAINLVNNVKPIKFTWKDKESEGVKAGYSAQQVVKSGFKDLIGHIPNEDLVETTDDEGFTSPEGFQLTMSYDQVTPYHGVVLKHLLDKIEQLEKEIKQLKNKIE